MMKRTTGLAGILPLALETRPTVNTAAAAYYMHLRPQTMRAHAAYGTGALKPFVLGGRLHWSTEDIRRVLGVSA